MRSFSMCTGVSESRRNVPFSLTRPARISSAACEREQTPSLESARARPMFREVLDRGAAKLPARFLIGSTFLRRGLRFFRVLYFAVTPGQPGASFAGLIVKRAYSAAIGDAAVFIDDVKTLRPRGVHKIGRVGHIIHAKGQWILEALGEVVGDGHALFQSFRLRVAHVVFHVRFHLPFIGGMRFAHVDGQEIGVVLIVVVNLDDVADLATEGRSSKAAENENEGPAGGAFANMETGLTIESEEPGVRSIVAHFQSATMHVRQRVP